MTLYFQFEKMFLKLSEEYLIYFCYVLLYNLGDDITGMNESENGPFKKYNSKYS